MSHATTPSDIASRHLQEIFGALSEGIIKLTPEGTIAWANRAALAIHGTSYVDALGDTVCGYIKRHALLDYNDEPFPSSEHPFERAIQGDFFDHLTVHLQAPAPHTPGRALQLDSLPLYNDAQQLEAVMMIIRDLGAIRPGASHVRNTPHPRAASHWHSASSPAALSLQHSLEELQAEQGHVRPRATNDHSASQSGHHEAPRSPMQDATTLRHAQAFRLAPVPMMLFDLDTYYLLDINEAVRESFGYPTERLLGHRLTELPMWQQSCGTLSSALAHLPIKHIPIVLQPMAGERVQCVLSARRVDIEQRPYILLVIQETGPLEHGDFDLLQFIESYTSEPGWLKRLVNEHLRAPAPTPSPAMDVSNPRISDLTPREREVLKLVCQGANDDKIAKTLGLSVNTVRNHLRAIYNKLDIHRRSALIVWALKQMGPGGAFD